MLVLFTSDQDFIKFIYECGPAALLVFTFGVPLTIAVRQLKAHPNEKLHRRIYVAVWIVAGIFSAIAVSVFWILHIKEQAVIRGTIDNLPISYQVRDLGSDNFSFYGRQEYSDSARSSIKYHWLATAPQRSTSTMLSIEVSKLLNENDTNGYDVELNLSIDDSFYDRPVEIIFIPKTSTYVLRVSGKPETKIEPKDISMDVLPIRPENRQGLTVYAATALDPAVMRSRLESPDPTIRRDARVDLSKFGSEGLPFIAGVLADQKSSLALQLGVIDALNLMAGFSSENQLGGKALANILKLRSSTNLDLAKAANLYVAHRSRAALHKALKDWLNANRKTGLRLSDIALADMDLLYEEGDNSRRAFRKAHDKSSFAAAESAFVEGWSDRLFADSSDRVYFARALYGWGLLLADREAFTRADPSKNNGDQILTAKKMFTQFLANTRQGSDDPAYPYNDDINVAKAYLGIRRPSAP